MIGPSARVADGSAAPFIEVDGCVGAAGGLEEAEGEVGVCWWEEG